MSGGGIAMSPLVIKVITIAFALILMFVSFMKYVRKKMSVTLCMSWWVAGVLLVLASVLPVVSRWINVLCSKDCLVFFFMMLALFVIIFQMSMLMSQLRSKNQELAMQVSLLNQENEIILSQIKEFKRLYGDGKEKNLVRD
jgi:hypothetical protein